MIFSSVAHAALFAVALAGFSQPRTFEEYQEAVPVEIVNENELRQMMRGERNAPKPLPTPQQKADRVAETSERKPDAPLAKQEVEVPPPPQRDLAAEKAAQEKAAQEKAAQQDKEEQERAVREARAAEAQKQREAAEKQRVASLAAAAAEKARQAAAEKARAEAEAKKEEEAEERREAELERARKQEEARKAAETKRIADEKRAAEEKKRKDAQALKEKLEREAEEAEERKQAELDKQKKAEEARKAAEAKKIADAKRAADEKVRRDAEARQQAARAQSEQKSFDPSDIQKLLHNKQRAATTGSTGPQPQQQASLGTHTGSAAKLNPSQREALIGILREQMGKCMSVPPGSNPNARPSLRVALNPDGSLAGAPALASGDQALGQAALRAIRACAPYRIPAKFAEFYGDWRSLLVTIDASDL